ncbi:hypothetical protein N658DRAFT_569498 [Parathielavia hyrcaniae]|uniref:Uncharacterized protein n=1 Tax=Parathielavia hyrcaniae TaxID=113614 RepID=A0AAN6PXH3_9PEZI|nr:hypothetical protein N658DRAFT_569498 [Parathielavia hyrcaniae]
MAPPEEPSHFTVHVFLSHDPLIARVFLPDLFLDFPDSAWKLRPLVEPPPPPREKPEKGGKSMPDEHWNPREVLGRHVFSEPLTGDTTLLQLAEKMEQEFAIPRKYQAHFTIFPEDQAYMYESGLWPLPWSTTLAEAHQLGLDAHEPDGDNEPTAEITKPDAPVLHLLLETKATALMRIVGPVFLDEGLGTPYRFVSYWNYLDSFWHYSCRRRQFSSSQLEFTLSAWRGAEFAGSCDDELRTSVPRVEEIREKQRQSGLSNGVYGALSDEARKLLQRIMKIEKTKANGHDQLRAISVFPSEVESKVAAVIRQARQVVDAWKSSEARGQLQASIEDEYYAAWPWLTEKDRANTERYRLDQLKYATWLPNPVIWGAGNTSAEDSIISYPHIRAHSMRRSDRTLLPNPSTSSFTMISLYSTMSHSDFTQNANSIPPEQEGGTILQHRFSHRCAARNGQWKVRLYNEKARIGRVRALDGTGPGADVLYVGRYDWSTLSLRDLRPEFQRWAEPVIGPAIPDPEDPNNLIPCNVLNGGYMIAIDEADFGLDFAAAYKRDCDRGSQDPHEASRVATPIEKMFRKDGRNFGTFLSMAHGGEDSAWLVFSGEHHADHGVDELVALVYSNGIVKEMYHSLEGEPSSL